MCEQLTEQLTGLQVFQNFWWRGKFIIQILASTIQSGPGNIREHSTHRDRGTPGGIKRAPAAPDTVIFRSGCSSQLSYNPRELGCKIICPEVYATGLFFFFFEHLIKCFSEFSPHQTSLHLTPFIEYRSPWCTPS